MSSDNSCDVPLELSSDVVSSMHGLLTGVDEKHEASWLLDQDMPECSQGNTWVPKFFHTHDNETHKKQNNKLFPANSTKMHITSSQ